MGSMPGGKAGQSRAAAGPARLVGRRRLSRGLLPLLLGGVGRGVDGVAAQGESPDLSAAEQEAEVVMHASAQPLLQFLQRASLAGLLDKRPGWCVAGRRAGRSAVPW